MPDSPLLPGASGLLAAVAALSLAILVFLLWSVLSLRRDLGRLSGRLDRLRKDAEGAARREPKGEAPKELRLPPVRRDLTSQTEPGVALEEVDYLPGPSGAGGSEPEDARPEKRVMPAADAPTRPPDPPRQGGQSPLELPVDEFRLDRLDFESVLADPAGDSLPSLEEKTDVRPCEAEAGAAQERLDLVFDGFGEFVSECGSGLGREGMFVKTSSPKPVGTALDLAVRLKDGYKLLEGKGEVVTVAHRPERGMSIRFTRLDEDGRRLIEKIVAQRERL